MSSTTLIPCKTCLHHPIYLTSIIGIVLGLVCLSGGSCVILLWAFTPGFSQSHPIALKVSAIICTLGVITVLCSVICSYCYHVKLRNSLCSNRCVHYSHSSSSNHNAHQQDSVRTDNYNYKRPTPSSSSMPDAINLNGLKKNKSNAFVSLGSLQLEAYEVLGVLHHGTSNTDTIRPGTRKHRSTTDSEDIKQNIMFFDDNFGDTGQRPKLYFRPASKSTHLFHSSDKTISHVGRLQGSLPRIYLQRLNEKDPEMLMTRMNTDEEDPVPLNVRRTRSDRVKSGGLSQPVLTSSAKVSSSSKPDRTQHLGPNSSESARPLGCPTTRNGDQDDDDDDEVDREIDDPISPLPLTSTTPPIGQASLFNLDTADYGANLILRTSTTSAAVKVKEHSHSVGEQPTSSRRLVLMRESGHVLSCSTLFDDEEESSGAAAPAATGRRLQACPGWNIFPVYLKRDKSDNLGTSDDETNDPTRVCPDPGELEASIPNPTTRVKQDDSRSGGRIARPLRSLFGRMKSAVKRRWAGRQDSALPKGTSEAGTRLLGERRVTDASTNERYKTHRRTSTADTLDQSLSFALSEAKQDLDSTTQTDSVNQRKHAVITNASVFSLPAISPALWSAERPVWIMGVPTDDYSATDRWFAVDASEIILVSRKESQEMKSVTGSTSSIYAFHVKPPPRLKPATSTRVRHQHGRARSLGHMLTMEKSILKET